MDKKRGFRVVALDSHREIPDERVFGKHCFSTMLERSLWWAETIHLEVRDYVPDVDDFNSNGYAIVEIEAVEIEEDGFSPSPFDYCGNIIAMIRVVEKKVVVRKEPPKKKKNFIKRILSFFFFPNLFF